MFIYRVYTERKNMGVIERIARTVADGFTVLNADGVWKKQRENSVVFEFVGDKTLACAVVKFARSVKTLNWQDAVLVTSEKIQGGLI